ncbi:hypothetical protein H2200_002491 [Cladophialophora chaetospira]|uniref:NmrA-like domain-containing protein n=1 Tax=Cladophialophora chaetospira TaxID=386627 RepID=A0AA38XIZ3_9EURO|nr:hypothetical protein H2200_002491 [Cladophialophora chaetospira]
MSALLSFLIAGGTGRQGGAVVNALLTDKISPVTPQQIYVITRDTTGPVAAKLAAQGINLVPGVLGKSDSIFEHLRNQAIQLNHTGVYLVQAHGPTELDDARLFITAARNCGVQYLVYSSVDRGGKELSDRDASYCKTFSDKFQIEKHLITTASEFATGAKGDSGMDYTILRPVWFADNALWGFNGRLCMTGWRDNMKGKRMQVVATKDIGRWAAEAFLRPDEAHLRNTAVSIASDELTFEDIDRIFREETGKPVGVTNSWMTWFLIWVITDLRTMFSWINERDYGADLPWLARTVEATTFRQWLKETTQVEHRA